MNAMPPNSMRRSPARTYSSTRSGKRARGPLRAERALEVGVFDQRDRRVGVAERGAVLGDVAEKRLDHVGAEDLGTGLRGRSRRIVAAGAEEAADHEAERHGRGDARDKEDAAACDWAPWSAPR